MSRHELAHRTPPHPESANGFCIGGRHDVSLGILRGRGPSRILPPGRVRPRRSSDARPTDAGVLQIRCCRPPSAVDTATSTARGRVRAFWMDQRPDARRTRPSALLVTCYGLSDELLLAAARITVIDRPEHVLLPVRKEVFAHKTIVRVLDPEGRPLAGSQRV